MTKYRIFIFILSFVFLFCSFTMAVDEVFIKADSFSLDEATKILTMKNAVFLYKDVKISAVFSKYNTVTERGDLTGGVKIVQGSVVITGGRMKVLYKERKGFVMGKVKMERKEVLREPVILTCEEIEYSWENPVSTATGHVKIIQKDKIVFCDKAEYNMNSKLIHMTGNVRFQRGESQWLTGNEAYLDLQKDSFMAQGNIEGRFLIEGKVQEVKEGKILNEKLDDIDLDFIPSEFIREPLEKE